MGRFVCSTLDDDGMLVTANGDNKKCEKNWLKKLGELQEFLRKSKGSYEGM